ncbi:MAG: divergent PAP2 family protein [bacterium]
MLATIIFNKIIISAFFAALAAQYIKAMIAWKSSKEFHWRYLFISAGMPSSHTAAVTALTVSVFLIEGASPLFAAVAIFSMLVVRDVLGDKVFAQQQEDLVNNAIQTFVKKRSERIEWDQFIGHTFKEVIIGFCIGIIVTLLVF